MDEVTEVELELLHETEEAYLVRLEEDCEETWIPKTLVASVVSSIEDSETGEVVIITLELPEWVAIEKGLI